MTDIDLDLGALEASDEATLAIRHPQTGEPTTWLWTFYGPGHPSTVALANRLARDSLRKAAAQRQAQVNGKKWKEDEQSLDQLRAENAEAIVARTKGFTPVKLGAKTINFSAEAATALLLDRRKGWLIGQIMEFLRDEENFFQPSATA